MYRLLTGKLTSGGHRYKPVQWDKSKLFYVRTFGFWDVPVNAR